jgi:hypothetical protein
LYDFSTDFPNGYATAYNITTDRNGRLRVVIAWDASPQACQSDGSDCQGIALDGDLDLRLSKFSGGAWQLVCTSASFDSSWELCDVAVNSAEQYKAEVRLISPISSGTYLGIAWNTYDPASE